MEKSILEAAWPELLNDEPPEKGNEEEAPPGGTPRGEEAEKAPQGEEGGASGEAVAPEGESEEAGEASAEAEAEGQPLGLKEIIEKDEALRAEWEAEKATIFEEARRKAQSELQPRVDRANEYMAQLRATVTKAVEWIGGIAGALNKAVEEGHLDAPTLQSVLASNPEALQLFTSFSGAHGFYHAMRGVAASFAQEIGDQKYAQEWVRRWSEIEMGAEGDPAKVAPRAWQEMIKARDEWLKAKAEEPLRKKLAALEAQLEKVKAVARGRSGPDLAEKAGAGAPFSAEAIANMSDEEYKRRRPEIMRWLAEQFTRR